MLIAVVKNYVKTGEFELAKQIAEMIKDPDDEDEDDWKLEAVRALADGYAASGQFDKALEFAESLENDECHKDEALWAIGYRYAEIGQYELILQMVDRFLVSGGDPLGAIAELMVKQNLSCDRIIEIAKTLEKESYQKAMLSSIVYEYANTGNNSDKLFTFAKSVNDESIKYEALKHLAKSCLEAKEYDRVLEIAKSIGLEKVRVTSFGFIIPPDWSS